jgi:hypothetical protein
LGYSKIATTQTKAIQNNSKTTLGWVGIIIGKNRRRRHCRRRHHHLRRGLYKKMLENTNTTSKQLN